MKKTLMMRRMMMIDVQRVSSMANFENRNDICFSSGRFFILIPESSMSIHSILVISLSVEPISTLSALNTLSLVKCCDPALTQTRHSNS
jgi:hypothetical protein